MQDKFVHFAPEKWRNLMPPSARDDDWQFVIKILEMKTKSLQHFQQLQSSFFKQTWPSPPFIISIAGSVSVGKSTFAQELKQKLIDLNCNKKVAVVSADSFLMPNDELKAKGLMSEKGFPSSFNWQRIADFLEAAKLRKKHIPYQVYSHKLSDLSDKIDYIDCPDILIIEGINMLQTAPDGIISPSKFVDFGIYLDAEEADLESWYMQRFHQMLAINYDNPGNFFYQWAHKDRSEADKYADYVWKTVNLKNLRDYIAPTKKNADLIIKKEADHSIGDVYLGKF